VLRKESAPGSVAVGAVAVDAKLLAGGTPPRPLGDGQDLRDGQRW
jgi:hypothetical protein